MNGKITAGSNNISIKLPLFLSAVLSKQTIDECFSKIKVNTNVRMA